MYKGLKIFISFLILLLITVFSVWDILTNSAPMPGGVFQSVFILKSDRNLKKNLINLANSNHVVLAKQIVVKSKTPNGQFAGEYTFEKIGNGTLPQIYPEQRSARIVANSNDATNYIIIGNGLTANNLSKKLQSMGYTVLPVKTDMRLEPINDLLDKYKLPLLVMLISFVALLLSESVSRIKGDGVKRLAGMSRFKLAFIDLLRDIKWIGLLFLISSGGGAVYLYMVGRFWIYYLEALVITLFLGMCVLLLINFLLSSLTFLILQNQKINLSIKGERPVFVITLLIIIFQVIAIIVPMQSMTSVIHSEQQLSLLEAGQKIWEKNKNYDGITELGGMRFRTTPELNRQQKALFLDLLNMKGTLLACPSGLISAPDDVTWKKIEQQYLVSQDGTPQNVMYVNEEFLKKEQIKIPDNMKKIIKQFKAGEYAVLVPKAQQSRMDSIATMSEGIFSSQPDYNMTASPFVGIYEAKHSLFGYSVMKNQTINNSNVGYPVLVVFSPATFKNSSPQVLSIEISGFMSQGSILTTNQKEVNRLFVKNHMEANESSFFNGYRIISQKIAAQAQERDLLVGVNILCLLSSLLLISLLNSIYLYQNRKMFLIQRLAGKKWVDIHMVYLTVVLTLTAIISGIARVWLHVPNEAFLVPIVYVGLVLILFVAQMNKEKTANVLYLKGL